MTKEGGGQKSQKIDDVFYERPLFQAIVYNTMYFQDATTIFIFQKSYLIL